MGSIKPLMWYWPIFLLLLALPAWSGTIIKCRAADGSITFSDSKCPAGQEQLSKKTYQQRRIAKTTTLKNLEGSAEFPEDDSGSVISKLVFQSRFTQALSSSAVLKLSVTQYYTYQGKWPSSLEEIGLDPSEMTSAQIKATEMGDEGRIRFQLSDDFGERKEIWLYPKQVMGGMQVEWSCYSNFPPSMLNSLTGTALCQSRFF